MNSLIHSRGSFFGLRPNDDVKIGNLTYVVEKMTRGGMGCIYLLCLDTKRSPQSTGALGLKLALKAILPNSADIRGLALFKRELTVWAGFRHCNIVWLLEIIDGGDAGWIAAMDWCIGSLRDYLNEKGKLSIADCGFVMTQLIDGLAYAYGQDRVIHLDLKPENILYHINVDRFFFKNSRKEAAIEKFKFMISDWGISSIKQSAVNSIAGSIPVGGDSKHTFNNMGTFYYMAPERFKQGYSSTVASDVFSLGIMYFEMLTGIMPFSVDIHPVKSLISGQYILNAELIMKKQGIPTHVSHLVLEMIAYDPGNRPSDYAYLRGRIVSETDRTNKFLYRIFN